MEQTSLHPVMHARSWTTADALWYASLPRLAMNGPSTGSVTGRDSTAAGESRDSAFSTMFRAEFGYVLHSLRRLGVAARDLDDAAQEVFLAVHRAWGQYDRARPVRPWLFGFAFRVAANHRRAGWSRRVVLEEPTDVRDSAPDMVARLDADRNRALVIEALDALDLDHRAVLILVDIDGTPQSEVALSLGIPVGTVSSRLWHARRDFTAAVRRLRLKRGER